MLLGIVTRKTTKNEPMNEKYDIKIIRYIKFDIGLEFNLVLG